MFAGQAEIALSNLARIAPRVAGMVDVVNICGTDFGTQNSSFCSVPTFRELWMPYYRRVNDWIHKNTRLADLQAFVRCCREIHSVVYRDRV